MQLDRHDLAHEFAEHGEKIHRLKIDNAHFAQQFAAYASLSREIVRLEASSVAVADETLEDVKKQRLQLKDQLYAMLIA